MVVRLQILSDFHLEHKGIRPVNYESYIIPTGNVLGILGDISCPSDWKLNDFLRWCSQRFQLVLYIAGNHEYYNPKGETAAVIRDQLRSLCKNYPNVWFLDNQVYILDDVMFIGSTLWSVTPPYMEEYMSGFLNDYHLIHVAPGQKFTPAMSTQEFQRSLTFIQEQVALAKSQGLKAVVLTHHVPSKQQTSHPQYDNSETNCGFATTISWHHDPGAIRLWCCGHTHFNFHHDKEGYELLSNQVGYGGKPLPGYNPSLCVEL